MTKLISRCLRASRVTRTEGHLVPGHGQASSQPPSLLAGAAEHADRQGRNIWKITGVCGLHAWS
jgi:hypothetical protein